MIVDLPVGWEEDTGRGRRADRGAVEGATHWNAEGKACPVDGGVRNWRMISWVWNLEGEVKGILLLMGL